MKRVIIAIYTFCLSFSVFAQQNFSGMFQANEPEWVQSYREKGLLLGETFSEVCVMAGRSIFPVPEHGVERHMMAAYDALSEYSFLKLCQIDSTGLRTEALLDYDLLDTWTDNEKYEYVLLKIYPGRHRFTGRRSLFSEKAENNNSECEMFEYEYSFSAFPYTFNCEETRSSSSGKARTKIICRIGPYWYSRSN